MWRLSFILFAISFLAASPARAQSYEFPVEHAHTWRSCQGKLLITSEQIEYQTEHKEHARVWRYNELQEIKVWSPQKLELTSYEDQKWRMGLDRVLKFKLLNGEITPALSSLLLERAARPLVTSVLPANADKPTFEAPVKHLHRFGGCLGALKLYHDRIVYEAQELPSDSRY
jgi:hypothetical protein